MTEPHLATNRPRPILVPENARRMAVGPDLQPLLSELHAPGRSSFKVPHAPAEALAGKDDFCMNYLEAYRAKKFEF